MYAIYRQFPFGPMTQITIISFHAKLVTTNFKNKHLLEYFIQLKLKNY